ncbi:unnamed protein product [Cylindrotheca closterium]|uniref:Peptidase M16 N-terminal domain-containing protein n=1 Tax=Cylindrotheca closterium TaxID=2856 RepID=A0AAD2FZM5_9STRA|nr:unnamed protein product [Cylindrotheca closterium]
MRCVLVSDIAASASEASLSIADSGQFSDCFDGNAHLMEHIVLSSGYSDLDFDDWISSYDGYSNGFTAFEKVCFHFGCPNEVLQEALERFALLFTEKNVQDACNDKTILKREIRRINSELDPKNDFAKEMYLVKSLINQQHQYSRFSAGNIETLELWPERNNVDVGTKLFEFFKKKYLPEKAVLVVISPTDLKTLETWVAPFARTLSQTKPSSGETKQIFPRLMLSNGKLSSVCMLRQNPIGGQYPSDSYETLSIYFGLSLDYSDQNGVTGTQLGFALSQMFGRRGPGSLYKLLQQRKWTPVGSKGVPSISFPVDVSGFQLMKFQLFLTQHGFASRSSVVAAVYDAIGSFGASSVSTPNFEVNRKLVAQYLSIGQLYGWLLAPRPPDAVELAFDAQVYGVSEQKGIGGNNWYRLPLPQNAVAVASLQKSLADALRIMNDPFQSIAVVTASSQSIAAMRTKSFDDNLPLLPLSKWNSEPVTGAKYAFDDMFRLSGRLQEWILARSMEDELQPPSLNPLIPRFFRPARIIKKTEKIYQYPSVLQNDGGYWAVLGVASVTERNFFFPLPLTAPEPNCRCGFVLQLLSKRPARAKTLQAAHAELWKATLEIELADLAELGSPAGLAYEISFNRYGMRICFLGLSQNIGVYARRVVRKIVDHQTRLLDGPQKLPRSLVDTAITSVKQSRQLSSRRKIESIAIMRDTSATEAAVEAIAFFKSCSGGVCFSQGDLLAQETRGLLMDLRTILEPVLGRGTGTGVALPLINDIQYRANWVPRSASICSIAGAKLISDACGRIPR